MLITIKAKTNFGAVTYYPVCHAAKQFAELAGTKSLTVKTLKQLESMGHKIKDESIPTIWRNNDGIY